MTRFTVHTIETAPEATDRLFNLVGQTSLSPVELQVSFLTVSVFQGCAYCTVGHTYLARQADVPEPVVQALRESQVIEQPRLQALRLFTEAILRERGFAGDAAIEAFLAAGFTRAQVLEVVTIIAMKTLSNYVNNLTHTPRDPFMADATLAWDAPRHRGHK